MRLGFPFLESVRSLAPLCDEVIVAVGEGEDETEARLEELAKEIPLKIIRTEWDMQAVKGGTELARQTNIALDACKHEIVFYIQGDEVLHEEDYGHLAVDIDRLVAHPEAASLVLHWVHFFGDQHTVVHSRRWYRKEIRVFKKSSGLRSYKDAQGFRKLTDGKWTTLPALESRARMFHYGWVRPAELMATKTNEFQHWWHGKEGKLDKNTIFRPQYGVREFFGTHPKVMREYLAALPKVDQKFHNFSKPPKNKESLRLYVTDIIEKATGYRPGEFKNYSRIIQ